MNSIRFGFNLIKNFNSVKPYGLVSQIQRNFCLNNKFSQCKFSMASGPSAILSKKLLNYSIPIASLQSNLTFIRGYRYESKWLPKNIDEMPGAPRVIIKYSMKGKRTTCVDVLKRFKRLNWGIWIRPKSGATRKLWKKKGKRILRLKQNVFCNAKQSHMLDKMVTSYWRRERVHADDPYKPYLNREDFHITRPPRRHYY